MRTSWLILGALVAACSDGAAPIADAGLDSALVDAQAGADATPDAAVAPDAAAPDAAAPDAAAPDAAAPDAAAPDAAAPDAAAPDAGAPDAAIPDAATPDAATPDAAAPDAAAPDAAAPADAAALPTFLGPTPYLSIADSPFAGAALAVRHFEDFEDSLLNAPGVSATSFSIASSFGTTLIDSVDADDGVIDGTCQVGCDDLWASGSVTFMFDAAALGQLPTHVGLVWTDGGSGATVTLEAFDAAGASLGTRSGTGFADASFTGGTAEDRFFGVIWSGGVRQVRISNTAGGIEVDHLQYGW